MLNYSMFDLEANGYSPTKIHCVSVKRYRGNQVERFTLTNYADIRKFFEEEEVIVGHNIKVFDIPIIERIIFDGVQSERSHRILVQEGLIEPYKLNCRAIDTLPLSWTLYPEKNRHGLEDWGEYFGVPKPKIDDWENLTLEEYIHRCEEDVTINDKLFDKQLLYLQELYEGDNESMENYINYLTYKMDCAREQQFIRWKLDENLCRETLAVFREKSQEKKQSLVEVMPDNVKMKVVKRPKKMHKQNGDLSKRGERWVELLEEIGYPVDSTEQIEIEDKREEGNPNSHVQLKDWLFSLGWKPETFNYKKEKDSDKVTKIPQVNLPFGQGICPSVRKLYEVEPELENLEMYYVINHRIGLLKGFLRDVDEEGYLKARIAGLTNTLRFKHTELVNLPGYTGKHKPEEGKYNWKDGVHIRGCLIAPKGMKLCGSDMSSLEDRTKQHYMYFFDPEYVETMIKPGFDPHLDLAGFAYKMTNGELGLSEEDIQWYKDFDDKVEHTNDEKDRFNRIKKARSEFKTVNYAATYGSGATTMSRNSGMTIERCRTLLVAYWEKNWSLRTIEKHCRVKKINGQMWLFNPVSRFWYSLRYEKDKFSTLNQGTGVYCFDNWVRECRSQGVKICGQFHDEIITPVEEGKELEVENKLKFSIAEVNRKLGLNRELDVDVQFGDNYAQIH